MKKANGWVAAPIPQNEPERLQAIRNYNILDTLPEDAFDRITRLASRILKTPIALVSLVDSDRQWFKSHHGLDVTETPRDLAFCAHAILGDGVMVVPNATEDPRFFGNPLVTGQPDIRFYAGAPLKTADGHKLGTLCAIDRKSRTDFTEDDQKALADLAAMVMDELDLRIAIKREIAANRAKSDFLANMSHEIRTPLNGVIGIADMLLETRLDRAQRGFAETIRNSGESLLMVINDILDFSKIEASMLTLNPVPFSLEDKIQNVTNALAPQFRDKKIALVIDYPPDLPRGFIGDKLRIRQILNNLVGNAIKFTERGQVTIAVRADKVTDLYADLMIKVIDTGIGIAEDKQELIFQKFTQADESTTRKFGGTGLGLAITQNLVALMDGAIGVKSKLGEGATFWFSLRLPRCKLEDHFSGEKPIQKSAPLSAKPVDLKILVAEDNKVNQTIISKMLQKFECKFDIVDNGKAVISQLGKSSYDLILMDCMMPEMDGFETTKAIREQPGLLSDIPIVALTAYSMAEDREKCADAGMNDFLCKPINQDDLFAMLLKYRPSAG